MKIPPISKRIWLVISTVIITGIFFSYYFLVYMENRQAELESKKFRTLEQYSENIKNSYEEALKRNDITKARRKVIDPIISQSDFDELLFYIQKSKHDSIEAQTFTNIVTESIVDSILAKDNAEITRQVEFRINNKDYIIFIHEFKLHQMRWRIFGFSERDDFIKSIRSVDLIYGVTASLFLILVLLMMPLLKLWVMNELEKLRTVNVWFCGFSLVVGSSFLLLIVLMANDFFTSYNSITKESSRNIRLGTLSDTIENRFVHELRAIYTQIQQSREYDSLITTKYHTLADSASFINEDTVGLYANVLKSKWLRFRAYRHFNELMWIKRNGYQNLIFATHELDTNDVVDLSQRKYFSEALADSTWMLPDAKNEHERFALQSIHSYLTSHHEAGFGTRVIRNNTESVVAIAAKLQTVMDPLLPPGYQFAIVGADGKVWFHSTIAKNLNENFFDETEWDTKLLAAVQGRDSVILDIQYDRNKHRAIVKPIRHTALYLIVLHDNEFFNTPIVLTVGLASFLVFLLFFVQGIHQLILLITTYRFSLLKINRFFLAWLRPQKDKLRLYRKAVIVQIVLLIPIGTIVAFYHPIYLVICFITLPVYLTVFHYFSLERVRIQQESAEQNRVFWLQPVLLTSVLLVLFINLSGYYYLAIDKIAFVVIFQGFVVAILLAAYLWEPSFYVKRYLIRYRELLFEDITGTINLFFIRLRSNRSVNILRRWRRTKIRPRHERFEKWYYAFLFLWLILASSVPTFYFYKIGYYEEGHVWVRHMQLMAARERETREACLSMELAKNFGREVIEMTEKGDYQDVSNEIIERKAAKNLNKKIESIKVTTKKGNTEFKKLKWSHFHELLFKGAPSLTGQAERSRAAVYPSAGDDQWAWYENNFSSLLKYQSSDGTIRYYESTLSPYRLFKGDYWMILLVINVLSVLVLYRTLRFCITHTFGLGLLSLESYKIPKLSPGARYFVVGLPYSGKSKLVEEIKNTSDIKVEKGNILEVDLSSNSFVAIKDSCQLVIANNFHLDLNNHDSNQKKLEKMEAFRRHPKLPVIVVSNLEPSTILEFYDKLSTYYHKDKGDYELEGNYRKCKQANRKWKNVLSAYSIYYNELKRDKHFDNKFIKYELNHGEYLPQLKCQLNSKISTTREREEMVLQVEELSLLYYQAIWNSLSCSEKFLLHDLAKDRFVNMRNMKTIRALRQKGLLIVRNSLYIMNKSFNNFILSIVAEDDEIKMEEEMRKKGSWNTLHLILVIAIVSILGFLGIAQQEMFKNFQGIIAATAALLPLLARFGGIFSGTKVKD